MTNVRTHLGVRIDSKSANSTWKDPHDVILDDKLLKRGDIKQNLK